MFNRMNRTKFSVNQSMLIIYLLIFINLKSTYSYHEYENKKHSDQTGHQFRQNLRHSNHHHHHHMHSYHHNHELSKENVLNIHSTYKTKLPYESRDLNRNDMLWHTASSGGPQRYSIHSSWPLVGTSGKKFANAPSLSGSSSTNSRWNTQWNNDENNEQEKRRRIQSVSHLTTNSFLPPHYKSESQQNDKNGKSSVWIHRKPDVWTSVNGHYHNHLAKKIKETTPLIQTINNKLDDYNKVNKQHDNIESDVNEQMDYAYEYDDDDELSDDVAVDNDDGMVSDYTDEPVHSYFLEDRGKDSRKRSVDHDIYVDDSPGDDSLQNADKMQTTTTERTLTAIKWEEVGTPEAAEKTFNEYRNREDRLKQEDRHLAMQHIRRMDQVCRLPLATIVTIPRLTHQYYHPPYTVLNRCSVNSLCCPPHNVNVPRNVTKVDLYFIRNEKNVRDVVKLTMDNHTDCHCIQQNRNRHPRLTIGQRCKCTKDYTIFDEETTAFESHDDTITTGQNRCWCDCKNDDSTCEAFKRGILGFSLDDRRCISDGSCTIPKCQYGMYSISNGRCPVSPYFK